MPLTDDQKQAIRDEELYRSEVRRNLAAPSKATLVGRLSAFLETKVGFWLATTVLAGAVVTAFTNLQRFVNRAEIERQERIARSLRDTETLLKLAPMLTSEKLAEFKIATVLLNGLTADAAVSEGVANQVKMLFAQTTEAGLKQGATEVERERTEAIAALADQSRIEAIQGTGSATATPTPAASPVASAIDKVALPVRIYIQIAASSDRAVGERARDTLRAAGLLVPGIEIVGPQRAPKRDEVRYCQDKVDPVNLERVRSAAATLTPPAALNVLAPKLCGNVRMNHFELWFAKR